MPITMLQHRDPAPLANRPVEWLAPLAKWLMGVVSALLVSCAHADDTGGGGSTPRTQTLHWMGTTDDNEVRWRTGIRWSERLRFGDLPVRNDMAVIYQQWIADDVRAQGLGMTRVSSYTDDYRQTISRCLAERVPDVNFDGYILIDIEFMPLIWGKRTGGPDLYEEADHGPRQFDTWYTYIRNNRPEVTQNLGTEAAEHALAETYEQAVREWLTLTFHLFRELRPNAKLSYYGMPMGSRHWQYNTPDPNIWKQRNDRLSWLVTLQDAQMIPLYQDRITVPEGTTPRGQWQNTIAQSEDWIISNLREARRIGQGKPVLVLAMVKYMEYIPGYELAFLQPINLDHMLRLPLVHGADGPIFWDHIENETKFNELQSFIDQSVVPLLLPMFQTGGGSGGAAIPAAAPVAAAIPAADLVVAATPAADLVVVAIPAAAPVAAAIPAAAPVAAVAIPAAVPATVATRAADLVTVVTRAVVLAVVATRVVVLAVAATRAVVLAVAATRAAALVVAAARAVVLAVAATRAGVLAVAATRAAAPVVAATRAVVLAVVATRAVVRVMVAIPAADLVVVATPAAVPVQGVLGPGADVVERLRVVVPVADPAGDQILRRGPGPQHLPSKLAAARARMGIVVRKAAPAQNLPRNRVTVSRIARPNQHLYRLSTGQTVRSPGLRVMERNNLIRVLPRTSSGTRP